LDRSVSNSVSSLSDSFGAATLPSFRASWRSNSNALIAVVPWPTDLLTIMILLLAAASLAELAVNVGLVRATGVFLQSVVTFACHMQVL